ncbi:MAG TPA: hypothetical protein PKE04_02760 [Clostridia bacterium]|nr:hypothetical protein [Clostridia bacterium]
MTRQSKKQRLALSKKVWLLYASMLILFTLFAGIYAAWPGGREIFIDLEKSFFSDYSVEMGEVLYRCHLTVVNAKNEPVRFYFEAYDSLNWKRRLLQTPEMAEVDETGQRVIHTLGGKEAASYDILLRGKHGGEMTKANRLLPERIETVLVE